MIDVLFAYYKGNIEEQHLPIDFAIVDFKYKGGGTTKVFYENLHKRFADEFAGWKIIPTNSGYLSIKNDDKCRVLDEEIYLHLEDEKIEKYIPAIVKYIPANYYDTQQRHNRMV